MVPLVWVRVPIITLTHNLIVYSLRVSRMGYPYLCSYVRMYPLAGIPYILRNYAHTRRYPYMRGCREKRCKATYISRIPFYPDQYIQISRNLKNGPHKGGPFSILPILEKKHKAATFFFKKPFWAWKDIYKPCWFVT